MWERTTPGYESQDGWRQAAGGRLGGQLSHDGQVGTLTALESHIAKPVTGSTSLGFPDSAALRVLAVETLTPDIGSADVAPSCSFPAEL